MTLIEVLPTNVEPPNQTPTFLISKRTFEIDNPSMEHLFHLEPNQVVNEVEKVLVKSISSRDDSDVTILYFYFRSLPFIAAIEKALGESALLMILSYITFEKTQHKRSICKQGLKMPALNFILSGKAIDKKVIAEQYLKADCTESIRKRVVSLNYIDRGSIIGDTHDFLSLVSMSPTHRAQHPIPECKSTVRVAGLAVKYGVLKRNYFIALLDLIGQTNARAKYSLIENCPLFRQHLNYKQLHILNKNFQPHTFFTGNFVYNENDPVESLYLISSGRFRVVKSTALRNNDDSTNLHTLKQPSYKRYSEVAVLEKGMCFGEEEIIQEKETRAFSVMCDSAVGEVFVIPAKEFIKIISDEFRIQERKGMETITQVKVDWRAKKFQQIKGVQLKYSKFLGPPPKYSQQMKNVEEQKKAKTTSITIDHRPFHKEDECSYSPSKRATIAEDTDNQLLFTQFVERQERQVATQDYATIAHRISKSMVIDTFPRSRSLKSQGNRKQLVLTSPKSTIQPQQTNAPSAPTLSRLGKLMPQRPPTSFKGISNSSEKSSNSNSYVEKSPENRATTLTVTSPKYQTTIRVSDAYSPQLRDSSNKKNKKFILPSISFEEYEQVYSRNTFAASQNNIQPYRSSFATHALPSSTKGILSSLSNQQKNLAEIEGELNAMPALNLTFYDEKDTTIRRETLTNSQKRQNYSQENEMLSYEVPLVARPTGTSQLERFHRSDTVSSKRSSTKDNTTFQFTPEDLGLEYLEKSGAIKRRLDPLKREADNLASREKGQKIIDHFILTYLYRKEKRNSRAFSVYTQSSGSQPLSQMEAFQPPIRPSTYQLLAKKNKKKREDIQLSSPPKDLVIDHNTNNNDQKQPLPAQSRNMNTPVPTSMKQSMITPEKHQRHHFSQKMQQY